MVGEGFKQFDCETTTIEAIQTIQSGTESSRSAQRKHRRFEIRSKVIVHPADSTDRGALRWRGECHDISRGGCRLLTQKPLQLGSVYWIEFEAGQFAVDPVFARCIRGQLMRETAFESGLCFLTPIELPPPDESVEVESVL